MIVALAGMHRSGTSMMARYLHHVGIHMGDEFYVETITNPYGHYEDLDFLNLQRNELAGAFGGQDYLVTEDFEPSEEFKREARALLEKKKESNQGRPWGWKDPRTTLFLEQWRELEPELRVLAMVRNPRKVVDSLCARLRGYFSVKKKELFLRTYTHYNAKILEFSKHHPESCHVVFLERLTDDPEAVLDRLSRVLAHPCGAETFGDLFDSRVMSRTRNALLLFNRKSLKDAEDIYRRVRKIGFPL